MFLIFVLLLLSSASSLIDGRSIFTEEQEEFLSEIFPPEMVNVQQIAEMAMNPDSLISNRTLMQLFSQANDIVNITGADSVLLEIDNVKNHNSSVKVLAVVDPDVPSHEDLLKKFKLYFVNYTETTLPSSSESQPQTLVSYSHPTYWQIFVDFLRNQANALVGALMIPINVSANAIQKSTQTHAEYVMSGSSLGSVVSAPVILKSISIPNIISQHMTDMASHQINNVELFSEQTKLITDHGIQAIVNGLNNGTQLIANGLSNGTQLIANGLSNGTAIVSEATDQYVIRPIGAFTGFNLNATGHHITNIGQSFKNAGINIHLLGEDVHSNAQKLVSAGATAIVWGLDDSVKF